MIHYKFVNIDFSLLALNATSITALMLWFGEHLNTIGGFIVMMSIAILNLAKAYKEVKSGKKD